MNKLTTILLTAMMIVIIGCGKYDDTEIKSDINDLKSRVEALEKLCDMMNENISSLHVIIAALQGNDYIDSVTDLPNNAGYTVKFTSGKVIYLYNGQDGKDGSDGIDGHTPIVSVMLDADGIYYWTIDGEWLIINGNKVRAAGIDGKDGEAGMTPRLKIQDDYWYISYDDGNTWNKLGTAIGANGKDGDSFFESVTIEDDYAVFVMNDANKTTIRIPLEKAMRVSSIKYVPDYSDGVARVAYYVGDNGRHIDTLLMKFEVTPRAAIKNIVDNWETILSAKVISTISSTRALGESFPIEINSVSESDNLLYVELILENLERRNWHLYNYNLFISCDPIGVISDNIHLEAFQKPEIEYTMKIGSLLEGLTISGVGETNIPFRHYKKNEMDRILIDQHYKSNILINISSEVRKNLLSFKVVTPIIIHTFRIPSATELTDIDLCNFIYASTSMDNMFINCSNLININLPTVNAPIITRMSGMFHGCSSLTHVNLSTINTSNVEVMSNLFNGCSSLKCIELSNFNTSKVAGMLGMFCGCSSLTKLDLSNFNTSNVIGMAKMFSGCSGLMNLDLSNFRTSNVIEMQSMFSNCSSLTSLDLSGFDTSNVIKMQSMFYGCSNLETLDISGWNTCDVADHRYMFSGCSKLKTIYMRGCDEATIAMIEAEKPAKAIIVTE